MTNTLSNGNLIFLSVVGSAVHSVGVSVTGSLWKLFHYSCDASSLAIYNSLSAVSCSLIFIE